MTRPSEVLRDALNARAGARRQSATRYLNRNTDASGVVGGWLSETGFYSDRPFTYARADPSNLETAPESPREINFVQVFLYGAKRDADRLASPLAADRQVTTTRAPGAAGLAPYPGVADYLGAADLAEDTSVAEKTSALLGRIRTTGSGEAYHAVITRGGAVYVAASVSCDVAGATEDGGVYVALEASAYRQRTSTEVLDTPLTYAQLESLAVLVAKLRAVYLGLPMLLSHHPNEPLPTLWWERNTDAAAEFEAMVTAEGAYDASAEVFRQTPPPVSRRAEAQVAIGHVDTLGASSLLLAAYADIAADDRSAQMQEPGRVRHYVQRARSAHTDANHDNHGAAQAGMSETLTPVISSATNTGPFVYDYLTGRWGDQ